jgi:CubicO group peptidase (beta-lactamase class C family)
MEWQSVRGLTGPSTLQPTQAMMILLLVGMTSTFSQAQTDDGQVATKLDATVSEWMQQHQVKAASLAVMHDGRIVKTSGYGGMDAGKPASMASLSKAVTGVCIARLIDEGHLSFSTPLGVVLSGAFQKFKQPEDARFQSVTIEQLLMHRGGLVRELPPGNTEPRELDDMFRKVLAIPLEADPGTKMSYSNIGYRILGKIVEVISKKSYEPYCRENVLTPMSASGSIERRGIGPSGGWRISPIDYAKFMEVFDPKSSLLGKESRAWLDTRREVPTYGLGMFIRRTGNRVVYLHDGKDVRGGGTYAIKFGNGWTTVVAFAGHHNNDVYGDLRRRLESAVSE